ncbi:hypothetical protein M0802_011738 [Mischocyttarus mexicanus]|nr:hypothetical protein M0802_011738 [Mischocyttarus mexicanus]
MKRNPFVERESYSMAPREDGGSKCHHTRSTGSSPLPEGVIAEDYQGGSNGRLAFVKPITLFIAGCTLPKPANQTYCLNSSAIKCSTQFLHQQNWSTDNE